jgi:hypothetical protein
LDSSAIEKDEICGRCGFFPPTAKGIMYSQCVWKRDQQRLANNENVSAAPCTEASSHAQMTLTHPEAPNGSTHLPTAPTASLLSASARLVESFSISSTQRFRM